MREFASTRYRLTHAPRWQKLLYSGFLLFMLIGLATSVAYGVTRTGLTPQTVVDYYRGNPDRMVFEKTFQELLDVTHVHAFVMPLALLVLGHLFFLTGSPAGRKRIVGLVALVSVFAELVTPWGVRYLHPAWAYVKLAAFYGMLGSFACLIGIPLGDMWGRHD